jgi:ketosteroid isomerase-like protein
MHGNTPVFHTLTGAGFFSNEQPIKQRDKTMKTRLLDALVGLAISFALPTFAQQANTPDPQLREQLLALSKKFDGAYNKGDAAALAALYTEDAIEVTDQGPICGRKALEKHFADLFQKVHFSNHLLTLDQDSPHIIGTTGNEAWETGAWSLTVQGENFGPIQQKGYHSSIAVREDGVWKKRLVTWNVTPAPAAKPSPTTSPSSQ